MLKLVSSDSDILYQKASLVRTFGSHWRPTLDSMLLVMRDNGGIGLAAPQVGISKAIAVIQLAPDQPVYEIFNPIFIDADGKNSQVEGCLSFPGLAVKKYRYDSVQISYKDMMGQKQLLVAGGLLARVVMHELDHINGKVIGDRLHVT